MILVDTSVIIGYIRGENDRGTEKFEEVLDLNLPYGINSYIYQEVLQGALTERDYKFLKEYLDTLKFYELLNGRESFASAARMYFLCRKKGVVVKSMIDFIIVETALENELFLLHNDKDFVLIKRVVPELKFY